MRTPYIITFRWKEPIEDSYARLALLDLDEAKQIGDIIAWFQYHGDDGCCLAYPDLIPVHANVTALERTDDDDPDSVLVGLRATASELGLQCRYTETNVPGENYQDNDEEGTPRRCPQLDAILKLS